jgi:hypothetical protein
MKAREPKPDISTALTVEHFCQMFGVIMGPASANLHNRRH